MDEPIQTKVGIGYAGYNCNTGTIVIDIDFLITTLQNYREQLLENKHKKITDANLVIYENEVPFFELYLKSNIKQYLDNFGLSLGNTGNVTIKRQHKPKIQKSIIDKKGINRQFSYILESFIKAKLGFYIKFGVNNKTLYNILIAVKAMCPNTSYNTLIEGSLYPYNCWSHHKECEEFWNNPELTKVIPNKSTKRNKND
jgi:hypothetical protein